MSKRRTIVCLAAALVSIPAFATTTGDLLQTCSISPTQNKITDARKLLYTGNCVGVVSGTLQTYALFEPDLSKEKTICLPKIWSDEKGVKLFVKWAESHPEAAKLSAANGVLLAHQRAFPCK